MLQQSSSLLFNKLIYHITQDSSHSVKSLVRGADVVQSMIVKQDLLHDKNGNGLAEFRAGLHDPQAKGDNLCREEEVDHV